jgi:hypothetical protein
MNLTYTQWALIVVVAALLIVLGYRIGWNDGSEAGYYRGIQAGDCRVPGMIQPRFVL